MTSPTTGMPLLTPDSAWRQWKRAAADEDTMKAREQEDPHKDGYARDTNQAGKNVAQARAVWLHTMLGYFERRRLDAVENNRPASSDKELKGLGVPCADCLMIAGDKDRLHKIVKDESKLFPVWATCGGTAPDPRHVERPAW